MAITRAESVARRDEVVVPVRKITNQDLFDSLHDAWVDFLDIRGDLIFVGLLYPLIGIVAAVVTLEGSLLPMFFPIAAGISLMGPVVAIGFYEMARRHDLHDTAHWSHFFDVEKRPSAPGLLAVAALLVSIFLAWMIVAAALFVGLWGGEFPATIGGFAERLFTTPEGWALIVVGNLVGAAFAVLVLAISVVSLPMLVDCTVDARTAVATSIRAFSENKGVMIRWGLIIALFLILGSIPLFIGLAVVLPLLGYATWHLYTRVVDRSGLEMCKD